MSQENLPFLFLQLITGLLILWPLDWHRKRVEFIHVNLGCHFGADRDARGLDICFTELAETALSDRSVLLPKFKFFILFAVHDLSLLLVLLKGEDEFVGGNLEGIIGVTGAGRSNSSFALGHGVFILFVGGAQVGLGHL